MPASTVPVGTKGSGDCPVGEAVFRAVMAAVEIVNIEVAAAPVTATEADENMQGAPLGKPEQLSVTVPENPPLGVIVSVVVADVPGATEPDAGAAPMAKSVVVVAPDPAMAGHFA